ncbi:MAG TPA: S-layer homology domain-containing protein, partial [Chloroflexia bacterium]|nr:S-layer homology domain-containing protein [Chloroflexia bacterium]
NPDGSLDTTFGNGGIVSTDMGAMDKAYAIAIYSDGKLVVAGASRGRFALARYDSSGTLDPTFGAGGILTTDFANDDDRATSIVIQPDGKVVAAGYATTRTCAVDCTLYSDFALARYNLNGSLDATFGTAGKVTTDFGREDHVNGLVRQADGKLVAGGQTRHSIGGTGHDFGLARYNPDGSLDTTFGAGGKVITDFAGSHDGAYGLTLASKGKMVAVGYMTTGPSLYSTNFALTRYNYDGTLDSSFGSGGKVVTDFGSNTDNANATAMQANGKIIAAGYTLASGDSDFALARYRVTDETEPTNTPAPATPTSTAASASSTSIAATPISTSTAMPTCEVAFTDVQEGSTFYPFVRCLACHSILGGYSDNTFRPNNEVTRGQLSKIVANSANFNEPATGQTFEDVSPSDTFYQFIERMASRGIIGGYPCGGVSEPCGSGKPYFRPNANATRGQISKIVSEAAGIADPPGSQKFADVAPGSTFYDWVNRLANKGVMGGYNCGGAGEPCGPGNLPYFRPGNNATRGQTSKIVSGAFFPTCGAESKP